MSRDVTVLGPYIVGEIPEPWTHTFLDNDGNVVNLSGYNVRVTYVIGEGDQVIRNGILATDGTDGDASYVWVAADFATAGNMTGEMTVGNGSNRYAKSFRCTVRTPTGGALPAI